MADMLGTEELLLIGRVARVFYPREDVMASAQPKPGLRAAMPPAGFEPALQP
jgi:hypothetical protein